MARGKAKKKAETKNVPEGDQGETSLTASQESNSNNSHSSTSSRKRHTEEEIESYATAD